MTGLAQKNGAVVSHVRIADAARRHPCDADRRRRRQAGPRLRHPDRRRLRTARQDAEGRHQGAGQHGAGDAGGIHPRPRPRVSARFDGARDRGRRRAGRRRVPRRHPARHRPHGRLDRHQPVHGRLRLPARAPAARRSGDHARHRTQRRGRRIQQAELSLGPARGGGSGAGIEARRSLGRCRRRSACRSRWTRWSRAAPNFSTAYQDAAYARALHRFRRAGAHRRGREGPGRHGAHRSGRAVLLQAARRSRTSTKSRGCSPTAISRAASRPSSKATTNCGSTSPRRCWRKSIR